MIKIFVYFLGIKTQNSGYKRQATIPMFPGIEEYTHFEEFHVINGLCENDLSENGLRKELGLLPRVSHKGMDVDSLPTTVEESLKCYALYNLTGDLDNLLKSKLVSTKQIIQSKAQDQILINNHHKIFEMLCRYILQNDQQGSEVLKPYVRCLSLLDRSKDDSLDAIRFYVKHDLSVLLNKLLNQSKLTNAHIFRSRALDMGIENKSYKTLKTLANYVLRTNPKGKRKLATYLQNFQLLESVKTNLELSKIFKEVL